MHQFKTFQISRNIINRYDMHIVLEIWAILDLTNFLIS